MKFGKTKLKNNLILAPLAGYTDVGFRAVAILRGAGLTFSEMVSAKGLVYDGAKTKELLETSEYENPRAVQLFGREPEIFRKAASLYLENFDIIDVNMGCPVHKIIKNGEGSALLNDAPRIREIMLALREGAGNRTVTAKIRAGFDRVNAPEIAAVLEAAGADAVTVHPRLQNQFYSGKADYSVIKEVKDAVKIPVVGNGDVVSVEDYFRMKNTGCDFVMIGRGAVGNPYIFEDILNAENSRTDSENPRCRTAENSRKTSGSLSRKAVENGEITDEKTRHRTAENSEKNIKADILFQISVLKRFYDGRALVNHMKKHAAAYSKGMKNAKFLKDLVMRAENIDEFIRAVNEYF
jgi:tRNA-dihydrouridine synthase B